MLDLFEILRGHHPTAGNHEKALFHLSYFKRRVKFEMYLSSLQE